MLVASLSACKIRRIPGPVANLLTESETLFRFGSLSEDSDADVPLPSCLCRRGRDCGGLELGDVCRDSELLQTEGLCTWVHLLIHHMRG